MTPKNYDPDLLTFQQYRPGFIIGESVIGESVLGVDVAGPILSNDFTSLQINYPGTIEQGVFVTVDASSAQLTTTDPDHLDLRGQRLALMYDGVQLYYGTVAQVSMNEEVQVGRPDLRGNTAVRTHRVTLRLQEGTEYMAAAPTPPRSFTNQTLAVRVQSLLGTTTTGADTSSEIDVDSGVMQNVGGWITDREKVLTTDDKGTLLDTIRGMLGRINKVLRPFFGLGYAEADSISRYVAGTTLAGTLRFSDTHALFGAPYMSYTSREVAENPELYPSGVVVTVSGVRYGPYDAASGQRVIDVDLGVMDFVGRDPQVARNFAATVPLKRTPEPYTSKITAPAQPDLFNPGSIKIPRMAVLYRDGVESQIAVIGVSHQLTKTGWLCDFDCAPPHLLTRHSDLDPAPVTDIQVDQPGGAGTGVRVRWKTPKNIPTDVPIYRSVYWQIFAASGGEVSTDAGHNILHHQLVGAEVAGAQQETTGHTIAAGLKFFYVQYTSDPAPASGVFSDTYRQGQARWVGYTVT